MPRRAVALLRAHGIDVRPSFLPVHALDDASSTSIALLDFVYEHDLVGSVDPVQYTIRLLLPPGSLLLDHPDMTPHLLAYDAEPPHLPDGATRIPRSTSSNATVAALVEELTGRDAPITEIYDAGAQQGRRAARRSHVGHDRQAAPQRELVLLRRAHSACSGRRSRPRAEVRPRHRPRVDRIRRGSCADIHLVRERGGEQLARRAGRSAQSRRGTTRCARRSSCAS